MGVSATGNTGALQRWHLIRLEAEMPTKLADLSKERTEIDTAIEQMMANMAEMAPEMRSTSDWASDGTLTKQFLDLTHRQAQLEAEIVAVSRAIAAAKKTLLP